MKPLERPEIHFHSSEWRAIKRTLQDRIPLLDAQNRKLSNTPDETLRIRVEIDIIEQMLQWDRVDTNESPKVPVYAVSQPKRRNA